MSERDVAALLKQGESMTRVYFDWGQDFAPYDVPVPRVPCVGEKVIGVDDIGEWVVSDVSYIYEGGFAFPPTRIVVKLSAVPGVPRG